MTNSSSSSCCRWEPQKKKNDLARVSCAAQPLIRAGEELLTDDLYVVRSQTVRVVDGSKRAPKIARTSYKAPPVQISVRYGIMLYWYTVLVYIPYNHSGRKCKDLLAFISMLKRCLYFRPEKYQVPGMHYRSTRFDVIATSSMVNSQHNK